MVCTVCPDLSVQKLRIITVYSLQCLCVCLCVNYCFSINDPSFHWYLGPYFFNTWFTDFFQNIKVGGEKKIKMKITKKNFLFNLKHFLIGEKKITKIV